MKISIRYGSHLPVLTKLVQETKGPILELGIGLYSTPYLHYACLPTKRKLVSYENEEGWIRYFRDCRSDYHEINYIDDWDKLETDDFWDIIFVDHHPGFRRSVETKRLADKANYIVIHDSEPQNDPNVKYSEIYPLFKYRLDYTASFPHTTVLSNFIDVGKLRIGTP